ncbi:T9SS type B sorting domain-containing protein [uncultured Algibacter sp.]|uniref:T9SS type B sorting domain-containing protein n=1 Tax=uncultured Algibacter sp. TaxID=298659 RepID=UPI002617B0A5|nr:T9SS type B sorting domain-containing protein [uncultured Algibacter sp.]
MYSKTKFFLISFCLVSVYSFCQNTFVPDDNFEQTLINLGWDSGPLDDFVPTANISGRTSLDVSFDITGLIISDLTGIEDFAALTQLYVQNNQLSTINVSQNNNLQILWCFNNLLSTLNVTQNPRLISLRCEDNQLTNLDVSNNSNLNVLVCERNQITTIDISNSTGLNRFQCGNNVLTNIDVSANANLSFFSCEQNQLTNLNLLNNTQLTSLYCFNNQITELDLSNNTSLTDLNCSNNQLCLLNLNNQNNNAFTAINFDINPDLYCVVVDNATGNHSTWVPNSFLNYVNSLEECSNFIPIDSFENVITTSYILPPLNNGNYFTETGGIGTTLNPGDIITTTQTIYIYSATTCNSNESSFMVIINNADYFIPKFFTPNNDGANDVWQVYDRLNLVNNISIYNRHGKLLKFLPSTKSSWDGTFNGELLSSGSYWYEIVLNTREILRGHFALKR